MCTSAAVISIKEVMKPMSRAWHRSESADDLSTAWRNAMIWPTVVYGEHGTVVYAVCVRTCATQA